MISILKKVLIFKGKIGFCSCNYFYLYFGIYQPIGAFVLVLKF